MAEQDCIPSTQKAEAEGSQVLNDVMRMYLKITAPKLLLTQTGKSIH